MSATTEARPLDPKVRVLWRLGIATGALVPVLAALGLAAATREPILVAGAVVLAALSGAAVIWYPPARYARWRWQLTELALELDRGVVWHVSEALPYFRIQHIDVTRSPLARVVGLADLQVHAASASVTLPGLAVAEAQQVRQGLLDRAQAAAAAGGADDAV